ncbi:MAG: relaxase/mobilization nuclease, partial [Hymenobacter sp.]
MISRTTIGRSFGGVVRYQFEGRKEQPSDKQAEVLVAVGVRADSAAHMSADFNRGRQLNPNLGQAVWHTSLSFNPDDAAKLDSVKMLAIAEGYVQKMG